MNYLDVMKHVVMLLRDGPDNGVQEAVDALTQAIEQAGKMEPVMIYHGDCIIDCGNDGHHNMEMLKMIPAGSKLYTHPPAQLAVPQGWKLVPVEPTEEMALAAEKATWIGTPNAKFAYRAMLSAAPTAPTAPAQPEHDWKSLYESQKRRAEMWIAKYEAVAGPDQRVYPAAPQQPASIQDAFEAGYWARETYNDTELSSLREKWEEYKAHIKGVSL